MTPASTNPTTEPAIVETTCAIRARPETVFRFFTDPERFARWWAGPGGGVATIDPRQGGLVRIAYQGGTVMRGRVLAIEPDRLFRFSWGYEGDGQVVAPESSTVEITLEQIPEGTMLRLRHSGLPTPEQRSGHEIGWRHYLSLMAGECAAEQVGAAAAGVMAAWFEAWGARDDTARLALLRQCCEPDVRFRDGWACVDGVENLGAHIGNALRHIQMTMTAATPAQHTHGFVRIGWQAAGPDGAIMMRGENFARLSLDGKLELVVGFADAPPAA